MKRARHDDFVPGLAEGESERLVAVSGAADGKTADVRAEKPGSAAFRLGEIPVLELDRIEAARHREVARDDNARETLGALVPGRCERVLTGGAAVEGRQVGAQ